MKAVVRECTVKGEEKQFLEVCSCLIIFLKTELFVYITYSMFFSPISLCYVVLQIWSKNIKMKSINLTALKKHGKVYEDEQFGCLVWSHSETHLLYVAEKKRPKAESFFQGEQFAYHEDWGEALVNKSCPVLCVLDIEGDNVSVLEGVPDDISPGQAFWAPGDTGVVFVGWWHEPFRLGLKFCPNRRYKYKYHCWGNSKYLSEGASFLCSPRLSPDQCRIIYLECSVYGPHMQCSKLCMVRQSGPTSVVVDEVKRSKEDGFAGIYCSQLSPKCWSADSQRVLISCPHVFLCLFCFIESDIGSWCLLNIERDLMVVSCSSPNCPPYLRVGFLPSRDSQEKVVWVTLEGSQMLPDIGWQIMTFTPPPEHDNSQYPGLDFEALLIKPKEVKAEGNLPLIVIPHGGPHSVIVAEWILSSSVLCSMGFAVLLVNYRGSLGFGQDNILSLLGNVGSQDVKDVQFAVESVLKNGDFDGQKVAVSGGSHGGFLACHLIGQHPGFYKACVARNPVTNLASMVGSTDIPDWCVVEAGYDYSPDCLPEPSVWEQMLNKSPIKHVTQVQTPVLLTLGEDDKRVPNKQGIEYYKALKARQIPVRLLWYPGNNHSLSKVDAESDGFMNIALWIIQHLSLR
uniref:acylaminoacyl-peptidase n=1 Tax=Oryzias sinensis TaxID=183150 RepID=A0A8C7Z3Y1_9TELE